MNPKGILILLCALPLIQSQHYKDCEVPLAFEAKGENLQIILAKDTAPLILKADNFILEPIDIHDSNVEKYDGFFCRESILPDENGAISEKLDLCEKYLMFTLGQWGSKVAKPTMRCFYITGRQKTDPVHLIILNRLSIRSPFEQIRQANSYVFMVGFLKELVAFVQKSSTHFLPFISQTDTAKKFYYWMRSIILEVREGQPNVRYRFIDHNAKSPAAENDSFNPMAAEVMVLLKRLFSGSKGCKYFIYHFEMNNSEISPASLVEKLPDFLDDPETIFKVVESGFKKNFMQIGPYEYLVHKKALKLVVMYYCVFRPQTTNSLLQFLHSLISLLPEPLSLLQDSKDPDTLIAYFLEPDKASTSAEIPAKVSHGDHFDLLFELENIEDNPIIYK